MLVDADHPRLYEVVALGDRVEQKIDVASM